jgi:LPXTG-motif cell wall-anchored protein
VGAGGAGLYQYGGGGGDVQVVSLATTGEVTITVGIGVDGNYTSDQDSVVTQGTNTTTAPGGLAPESSSLTYGGSSGNGNESTGPGGSGAGSSTEDNDGGLGLFVSDIPEAVGTLFADDTSCYSGGGASYFNVNDPTTISPGCGGGGTADESSSTGVAPLANSGGGGGSWYESNFGPHSQKGADGKVVIRYSPVELPDTGAADSTAGLVTGFGALLIGAGAVALGARRRKA